MLDLYTTDDHRLVDMDAAPFLEAVPNPEPLPDADRPAWDHTDDDYERAA
jgi:hypothetical protein